MVTSIIIAAVVASAILVWLSVSKINSAPQATREEILWEINACSTAEIEKIKNEIEEITVSNPDLKELGDHIVEAWEGLAHGETEGAIEAYQMVMAMDEEHADGEGFDRLEHLLLAALRRVN